MRRERNIVRFGHVGDSSYLADAAAVRDVGLEHVDGGVVQEPLDVPARVKSFAEGDGDGGEAGELLDALVVFGEKGFFDEKGAVRFEGFGELFGHGFVQASVEVEANV